MDGREAAEEKKQVRQELHWVGPDCNVPAVTAAVARVVPSG